MRRSLRFVSLHKTIKEEFQSSQLQKEGICSMRNLPQSKAVLMDYLENIFLSFALLPSNSMNLTLGCCQIYNSVKQTLQAFPTYNWVSLLLQRLKLQQFASLLKTYNVFCTDFLLGIRADKRIKNSKNLCLKNKSQGISFIFFKFEESSQNNFHFYLALY